MPFLKIENIFYDFENVEKMDDVFKGQEILFENNKALYFSMDDKWFRVKFYLADFDKSSIMYHNIRFYNDYKSTHANIGKFIDPHRR